MIDSGTSAPALHQSPDAADRSIRFPEEAARENPHFFLEAPRTGGHVGFAIRPLDSTAESWAERRACAFLDSVMER